MVHKNIFGILFAALALSGAQACAGDTDSAVRPIDERRPLNADGRVYVNNVSGTIEVSAWDKNEVYVTGELGEGAEKLDISGDAASLRIEVKMPKRSHDVEDTSLHLRVPAGARLDLEGVSADVIVQGVRGALNAQSVSGDVTLSVESAEVEVQTVSGELSLRAPRARNTRVSTVSGDVRVNGVRERLRVETVSGDVRVSAEGISDAELKAVSGDFHIELGLGAAPRVVAETMSGEIQLELPSAPDALLSLHTFSGVLQSDFGPRVADDKKRYETTLGTGKGRIDLSSFSGDVILRKR